MAEYSLTFAIGFAENLSPLRESGDRDGWHGYMQAGRVLNRIADAVAEFGLPTAPVETTEMLSGGRFDGGGPIKDHTKRLAIITASAGVFASALGTIQPFVLELLENRRSATIEYSDGTHIVKITGRNDFERVVEALNAACAHEDPGPAASPGRVAADRG